MPTTKKRVNLTLPDEIYTQLQDYKKDNALENDATACLQLIVLQLRAQKNTKIMMEALQNMPRDLVMQNSIEGMNLILDEIDKSRK